MLCIFLRYLCFILWVAIPVQSLLETLMKESIKKAMQCKSKEETHEPVIAFSPARYVQLIAMTRHHNKEFTCGPEPENGFHLNNPKTWGFCVIGLCSKERCYCFQPFTGDKCQKFKGRCWLFYCRLAGCNSALTSLLCACSPDFYGMQVLSGEYWYDDGLSNVYLPPPNDWFDSVQIRSKIFYKYQGHFFVAGGNTNQEVIPRVTKTQLQASDVRDRKFYSSLPYGNKRNVIKEQENLHYISQNNPNTNHHFKDLHNLFNPQTVALVPDVKLTVESSEYDSESIAEDDIEHAANKRKDRAPQEDDEVFEEDDGNDVNLEEDGELNQPSSTSRRSFKCCLVHGCLIVLILVNGIPGGLV